MNARSEAMHRLLKLLLVMPICLAGAYTAPPRGKPTSPLKISGPNFVNSTGAVKKLKGFNYFGFNNGQTGPDGLWAGGVQAATDFSYIVYQMHALGFNAVRLPFIFDDLLNKQPKSLSIPCRPSSPVDLQARTRDPAVKTNATLPAPRAPLPGTVNGMCNTYLPFSSVLDRYLWVIQKVISEGMYVLIDYHPMGLEATVYNTPAFVNNWKAVWRAVTNLPNFDADIKGRIFIDILNEPDSMGLRWEPQGARPGLASTLLGTMDALETIRPGVAVYFVEGGGQVAFNGVNWGNGFVTNKTQIQLYGISDANPFFRALMTKPYLSRVVIAPHVYGPSVTMLTTGYSGPALWSMLSSSFGYLTTKGYCNATKCHVFPAVVGEFGSKFLDPRDIQHLQDFAAWCRAEGAGNDKQHAAIAGYFYWAYNANSGDTGGLVDNSWQLFMWAKIRFLVKSFWLTPWYSV
jgi:aryl-phospho-beta-D-glucosidase BglC (GH1 family)